MQKELKLDFDAISEGHHYLYELSKKFCLRLYIQINLVGVRTNIIELKSSPKDN